MSSSMEGSHQGAGYGSSYGSMQIDPPLELSPDRFSGGFNVNLVNPIPDRYKCPFCKKLMKDPVQTLNPPCEGDRACRSCYLEAQW